MDAVQKTLHPAAFASKELHVHKHKK